MVIRLKSKFELLQHFTIDQLKQLRDSSFNSLLNDTVESLKSEFETFKSVSFPSHSTPVEISKKSKSSEGSVSLNVKRKPVVIISTLVEDVKMVATPLVKVYESIEDVQEPTIRKMLEKYTNFGNQSGLLSPDFKMHFNEKP